MTKTDGNQHARRLLLGAAWAYQHRPRGPGRGPPTDARAGKPRSGCTAATTASLPNGGKRSTVATIAIARELACFLWAAATDQPFALEAAA